MIKNIVFDLGGVLVEFDPLEYLNIFDFDKYIKDELYEIIFKSKDWKEYDRGIYRHNVDIIKIISSKYPKFAKEIGMVLNDDWVKMHDLKNDTVNYLKELKDQGYNIYILSNISEDSYNFVSKYDFFNLIDGGVYSYDVNLCKPDVEIYELLLKKYNLEPTETVFIDDRLDNIETANTLNICGTQFKTLEYVKEEMRKL